ncbi:MAG: ROK family protein [Candidatus Eisenbacteria bacterium]|nr:ROK family protein [Candidatus Eisenbacteria bacterium]MBU1950439.1 ROK family protein [Candidatus Eisenbacteria bacterium]
MIDRQRKLLQLLRQKGALSRSEMSRLSGFRPNTVGDLIASLLDAEIIRECGSVPSQGGRPRLPLEIDPTRRHVVGLGIAPGLISCARLNLRGSVIEGPFLEEAHGAGQIVNAAKKLLSRTIDPKTLGIGISVTGFVDGDTKTILFSSSTPGERAVSLEKLTEATKELPVIMNNDMQALAANWMLFHRELIFDDTLLVRIGDGSIGASMLVNGMPVCGCISGANELGHMRFLVETERCYCGFEGCLEQIFSTSYLKKIHPGDHRSLFEQIRWYDSGNPSLDTLIRYLSTGIANAVNLIRPHRLVLAGEMISCGSFMAELTRLVRLGILPELVDCIRVDMWDHPSTHDAEIGGWLALAGFYLEGWCIRREQSPRGGRSTLDSP